MTGPAAARCIRVTAAAWLMGSRLEPAYRERSMRRTLLLELAILALSRWCDAQLLAGFACVPLKMARSSL